MGKHFALSMRLPQYQHQSRKAREIQMPSRHSRNYGPVLFWACLLLGIAYLFQVNSFSTKGFEIRSLQKEVSNLQEQRQLLEVQAAQLQSLQKIQTEQNLSNLVPAGPLSYVRGSSFSQK